MHFQNLYFMMLVFLFQPLFLNIFKHISEYFRRTGLIKNWIWTKIQDTMCSEKLSLSLKQRWRCPGNFTTSKASCRVQQFSQKLCQGCVRILSVFLLFSSMQGGRVIKFKHSLLGNSVLSQGLYADVQYFYACYYYGFCMSANMCRCRAHHFRNRIDFAVWCNSLLSKW